MNMRFFDYEHLPDHLQVVSKPFHDLAKMVHQTLQHHRKGITEEQEMCLRKLLEAKDCAVRARIEMD